MPEEHAEAEVTQEVSAVPEDQSFQDVSREPSGTVTTIIQGSPVCDDNDGSVQQILYGGALTEYLSEDMCSAVLQSLDMHVWSTGSLDIGSRHAV